jgi:uncharacterized protein YggE
MKKALLLSALTLAVICSTYGQSQPERRVIEVSGSAERLITPNEFTFKITLAERIENKQKITIEQQESALRSELQGLGVDVANDLSIYDMTSTYFRQKKVKDTLGTKDYRLKLRDLNKIARLQDIADKLNVSKLDLTDTEHSDITRLRRETKIDAIKAAKEKADYLLAAIGQHAGKAVLIQEVADETPRSISSGVLNSNTVVYANNSRSTYSSSADDDNLSFSQIRLRYIIVAKFEIE